MSVKAHGYVLSNVSAAHSASAKSVLKAAFFFLSGGNIALNELTKHRGLFGCSLQGLWKSPG